MVNLDKLLASTGDINGQLARYGVKFGIYKNGEFKEQLFPYDPIPRIIGKEEFAYLERGLKQRVKALNLFLKDVYNEKQIIKDGVVPADFVYAASGYLAPCEGIIPPKEVYSHVSGIDLVLGKDGVWYILEDNLRVPSGASYPTIVRGLERLCSPRTFNETPIEDNRNYPKLLKHVMDYVNTGGISVVLTPGRYNAAYFEHSYLAEQMGIPLVTCNDLEVEGDYLYFTGYAGRKERVGAVYRRISDEYMDPLTFNPESLIGIPHIFDVYRKGNVALLNTPGNGIADDKGIYYFVPKMIEYYLDSLVIKDVAEAGGYGVVFGNKLTAEEKERFISMIVNEPRRFIAQEVIDFCDIPILDKDGQVERKADLRAFVLSSEEPVVWKSGLTRFSRNPDSFIVNSSQGGGFKDTWVLSQ